MTQSTPPYRPSNAGTITVSRRWLIAAVASAAVLVLAVAGLAVTVLVAQPAAAAETTLEPVNTPQEGSFLPEAGGTDTPGVTPPAGARGPTSGSSAGLFGGTGSNTCDRNAIATFLASHSDLKAAWADAQGINPGQTEDFLQHLSPVVLRTDTAVTNYGYTDGHLTSRAAVLESGTAVLVDGYGTPRVKCYCGNPLAAPPHRLPARYEGRAWPTFVQVNIVVVQPAPVIVNNFTIVNVITNNIYVVQPPPWSYGQAPPPRTQDSDTSSSDSTTTTTPTSTTTTTPTSTTTTTTTYLPPGSEPGTGGNRCSPQGGLVNGGSPATVPADTDGGTLTAPPDCGDQGGSTSSTTSSTTTATTTTTTTTPASESVTSESVTSG